MFKKELSLRFKIKKKSEKGGKNINAYLLQKHYVKGTFYLSFTCVKAHNFGEMLMRKNLQYSCLKILKWVQHSMQKGKDDRKSEKRVYEKDTQRKRETTAMHACWKSAVWKGYSSLRFAMAILTNVFIRFERLEKKSMFGRLTSCKTR